MQVKPLYDRVVIRPIGGGEQETEGGIIIPELAAEKPEQGEVLEVGKGKVLDDGTREPVQVVMGDKVLYNRHAGMEIEVDDEKVLVMTEEDILAIFT